MLALLGSAALVLVAGASWVLPAAAGGEDLEPPGDIDVYIIDDSLTLKWGRNEESVNNVTFSAEYQTDEMENWLKMPECQHITGTECEFSLRDADIFTYMKFRVRAEKGKRTSSWNEVEQFIPFQRAHIGPPGVRLEAEDKAILVHISQPGEGGNMWADEIFNFKYQIVFWQKSSGVTQNVTTKFCIEKILKLSPETTYCLKVEAIHLSLGRQSNFSEVQCINTTKANRLPVPENLEVDAQGESYVLSWDYASPNVSFRAEWLPGYSKVVPERCSDQWRPVPACANVQTPRCVFPQNATYTGTFFLRVQASHGNNTSFWSEEKLIDSQKYTAIRPPTVAITPTGESLLVNVSCQDSSSKCQGLTYEISFWEISSNTKRKVVQSSPEFTIMNLPPLTVYCVEARVYPFASQHKSSNFSKRVCEKTRAGNSPVIWAVTGLGILFFCALVFYAGKSILKDLSHVFSSPKPPPSIHELFSEPPLKNLLLLTPEEHTERCFVIESTNVVTVAEENHAPEEDHRKYSFQTSQDSGNYSNEEEGTGSESSQGLRP
ncbi:interferon alpha/beta receptor 1 isoform X3 [Alexandromys fortis]|uniref:interferon alpha/beta receptor 1 isoform X1 n=1 Tax=Alexandromys fortis TaxID=100897 RepID=UPI002152E5F8|nr:interferon alpha/beta receptor 1 isoform X1 [Microtus fortis]XP_050020780.1 interferon alpha/beta receptor 1 isoform X2 [Microtus fortis]XP_050020781.1 interferon alpha/beta receptor 1 isoform X3 [Microtus fortis]